VSGWLGYGAAFLAGLVSFLSPCVLPLVPAYLSFLTGIGVSEMREQQRPSVALMFPAVLFVAGFTVVFVALGASASILGSILAPYRDVLSRAAGILIILMGVLMLGIIRVPFLYGEARMDLGKARAFGRGAALVMGMAFAFGWTPCVGPILASILALAGSSTQVVRGAALLLAYAAGLALPFLAVAALFGRLTGVLAWLNRHSAIFSRVAGVLLIIMGLLVVTGRLRIVAGLLLKLIPGLRFG